MARNPLEALRRSMLGCCRCAALVRCRSRVVPGAGAVPAAVAFLGLAPGRLGGDRTGIPFSGDRSGDLLRRMIAAAGLGRVFITNLVRCNPRDARGRNRDPSAGEIANCRPHLEAELELAKPLVTVCLGRVAWRLLAAAAACGEGRRPAPPAFAPRRAVPLAANGRLLYPMYHPGFVIRGAYPEGDYARDFARLGALVGRLGRAPLKSGAARRTLEVIS